MKLTDAVVEAASCWGKQENCQKLPQGNFLQQRKIRRNDEGPLPKTVAVRNEDLKIDAAMWVRDNAHKKGETNMTASTFVIG